jgi:hypothetical protein
LTVDLPFGTIKQHRPRSTVLTHLDIALPLDALTGYVRYREMQTKKTERDWAEAGGRAATEQDY